MRTSCLLHLVAFLLFICSSVSAQVSPDYLSPVKTELNKQWPNNRTINLVFHGHSVPSGFAKTPEVRTFDSYPYQLLARLKELYPDAVINVIITAKGGENSLQGVARFKHDVLIHRPDVLFIDYGLNDLTIDPQKTYKAWATMIKQAKKKKCKIILLTPSPDMRIDMADTANLLKKNTDQIVRLANGQQVGLVNSYQLFHSLFMKGDSLVNYMAQVNHPNKKGNAVIANEIFKWFK